MRDDSKAFFVSKINRPILVIDVDSDSTIQKMINDATSKDIKSHVKLELKDVETILKAGGLTASLSSSAIGDNAMKESLQPFIQYYKDCKINKAIVLSFTIHETFSIMRIKEAINEMLESFLEDTEILFSILLDNKLAIDEVKINSIIKIYR